MSSYRAFVKRSSFVFGGGGILANLGFILGRPLVFEEPIYTVFPKGFQPLSF